MGIELLSITLQPLHQPAKPDTIEGLSSELRIKPSTWACMLTLENLKWRGVAKVRMHVALCYSVILAIAITSHNIGRPELAHSIKNIPIELFTRYARSILQFTPKRTFSIRLKSAASSCGSGSDGE
jgi:hypothetical protein